MRRIRLLTTALAVTLACATMSPSASAQVRNDPAVIAEQQAAIAKLAMLHGEWRGKASITTPGGQINLVQTERVGPMLDGTALVIEGRGYAEDGKLAFNAFAVISYDAATDKFSMTSWTDGRNGKFPVTVTDSGFDWSTPGPGGASINYSATVSGDKWIETGTFSREGMPPIEFIKMDMAKLRDSDWPRGGFVTATE